MNAQQVEEYYKEFQNYRDTGRNIIEFYNKRAEQYDDASQNMSFDYINEYVPKELAKYLKSECSLEPSEVEVLDLACGTGVTAVGLKKVGFGKVDGADGSEAMLTVSRRLNIYRNLIQGMLTDADHFNIPDGTYDAVVSVGGVTVNHITIANALREFVRVLKKGGLAVYTVAPTVSKAEAMMEHARYLEKNAIEVVSVEHTLYGDAGKRYHDKCHVYVVKKL